jgi:polyhydroxybutyrate depolymerase
MDQYVSYDGEHSWPGGLATGGVTVSNQFSATLLMWQFFQNYTTTCSTLGINNIPEKVNLKVYPNPFTDKIKLTNTTGLEIYILLNSIGQVIWTGSKIEQTDFSYLTKGLYILKVDSKMIKLIKE